ncbi:extracellular solute-binding protein [Dactylosporangium sucinum]|uniref:Sugar ABC transporter substrate-binding protein n=1 Tax=Dactylosporangium sucinum TaxID=1424081 RepID=A0A917SYL9_9ACTN|nr:sugar ABC transporter substrate-binding protein [Dactylosporangium sucinum]GGM02843.1 sugar ABC transporter substrate-binding protein [Dactylosporangium sucinum]
MSGRHPSLRLVATLAFAGLLAACGSGAAPAKDQDPGAQLEIWVRKPPGSNTEKTTKELAAKFTERSGVPTHVTALFDDFETKLQQAAAQKQLPDIVINDTAQLGLLVKQGIVREVDRAGIDGQDMLTPASWEAAKGADGKFYGVPNSAQSFALFIRKDWRERLGLSQPRSWADLDALATAFTTKDPDGNGKADTYGYVVPGSTKRGYMSWYLTSFLWAAGGDYFTEKDGKFTPAIASDQAVAAVEWLKAQFCVAKTVVPGAVTMETTQAHPAFETGKGGIYFTGPYNMARFDKNLGADKYEVLPAPPGPSGKSASLAEGENIYLMAGSKNQAGQEKFAEFAISVDGQTIGMAGDTDGNIVRLPVNSRVTLASVRKDTRWDVFDKVYKEVGRYTPAVPDWTPFRQASSDTVNAIVADCGSNPKQQLTKLADTFQQELTKQGAAA